jgi:hypothetical protein
MKTSTAFIFDSSEFLPFNDMCILEQNEDWKGSGIPKVIFKAKLQEAELRNSNGRWYSQPICNEIVETLAPKAKARCLFQEIDHPLVEGGSDIARKRAINVEMKNCGSLIRNIYMEGKDIIAEIESLTGFMGPDLARTIIYDHADIGFSLRMFGRIVMEETAGVSIAKVEKPIRPVTYDIVTNPSHVSAKIVEFLPESASSFINEESADMSLLEESALSLDNIHLPNVNEDIYSYLRELIKEAFHDVGIVQFNL